MKKASTAVKNNKKLGIAVEWNAKQSFLWFSDLHPRMKMRWW